MLPLSRDLYDGDYMAKYSPIYQDLETRLQDDFFNPEGKKLSMVISNLKTGI